MEKQEQEKDFFSQWGEFQKRFYSQWAESYSKMYQPCMDAMKLWQDKKTPFTAPEFFSKWSEMIQETIGKAAKQAEG